MEVLRAASISSTALKNYQPLPAQLVPNLVTLSWYSPARKKKRGKQQVTCGCTSANDWVCAAMMILNYCGYLISHCSNMLRKIIAGLQGITHLHRLSLTI